MLWSSSLGLGRQTGTEILRKWACRRMPTDCWPRRSLNVELPRYELTREALPIGHLHRQNLAPAFPVNAQCDQHGLRGNDAILAQLLVTGIEDEMG